MIVNHRWKALNIELSQGLPPLSKEPGYDGVRAVFFHHGMPLGHALIGASQLPLDPAQFACIAATSISTATGDYILDQGFRSSLPGGPPVALENPLEALQSL